MDIQLPTSEADLQEQVIRLTHEKQELADYAERVTRELRRYQQSRPAPPARPDDDLPLPPWATNMQMMSPLLFAYEERIAELEAVIDRSVCLAEQAQILTKENDSLRLELHERTEQLRNAQMLAPLRETSHPGAQHEDLQELYRLSIEQNEALAQQNQLLKLQLERMQQSIATGQQQLREVQTRATEGTRALASEQEHIAAAFNSEQERWASALRAEKERVATEQQRVIAEQQRVEAFARQRGIAEQRLEEITGELVEEVKVREQLEAQVESLRHDLQIRQQSLDLYRKSVDDRCNIDQDEQERLQANLERISRSDKEHRQRICDLENELMEMKDHLFIARRDGDSAKQEAEKMLPLMISMDRRLKDATNRHDQAAAKLVEQENQVNDLLIEKDFWNTTEQGMQRQTERLDARLKSEAEELSRRTPNHELESLRTSHQKAVVELENKFQNSENMLAEVQARVDLSEKQRAWEAAAVERQKSVLEIERERYQSDLEEAMQVRLRLERQISTAQQQVQDAQSELSSAKVESREFLNRANTDLANVRSRCQNAERQLSRTREEMLTSEALATSSTGKCTRLHDELREVQFKAAETSEEERRRAQGERHGLERQIQSLRSKLHQDEQRACELLKAQESLRAKWQTELTLEKETLEMQVERLTKENRAIREKSRGVLKALASRRYTGDELRLLPSGSSRPPGPP